MTTLDQLAYNVLNLSSGGRSTHNEHISLRQIKDWIHQYRSIYIRRDEERNRRLREFEQSIADLEMETVKVGNPATGEFSILRTVTALPRLIRLKDNEALTYAGDSLGISSYQVVDNHSVQWRRFSLWTPQEPCVFIQTDGRVYLHILPDQDGSPSPEPKKLTVRGIFENPEDVHEFLIDQGQVSEGSVWEYPLPNDMAESITKNILQTEMNAAKTSPLDTKQDNLPDHQMRQ